MPLNEREEGRSNHIPMIIKATIMVDGMAGGVGNSM
jgi:hypothetical protein